MFGLGVFLVGSLAGGLILGFSSRAGGGDCLVEFFPFCFGFGLFWFLSLARPSSIFPLFSSIISYLILGSSFGLEQ